MIVRQKLVISEMCALPCCKFIKEGHLSVMGAGRMVRWYSLVSVYQDYFALVRFQMFAWSSLHVQMV
jgi:hypothetical protein